MCTSDARSVTACDRIRFTTWTTGAFSSTVWLSGSSTCVAEPRLRALFEHADVLADARRRLVRDVDRTPYIGESGDVELRRLVELVAQLVDERGLRRVRDRDVVTEVGLAQRDREPVACVLSGQRGDRVVGRDALAQVDDFETELVRERRRKVALLEDAGVDEVLPETLA